MKIRDGLIQAGSIKVGQHHLELSKGLPGITYDVQVVRGVIGIGRNIVEQPPKALIVHQVRLPISRVMEVQHALFGRLGVYVLGYQVNVAHDLNGIFEHIRVHCLHDV